MAKFFVGQRVKVISVCEPKTNSHLVGQEGVVNEVNCEWESASGDRSDGIGVTLLGIDDWAFGEWQLEPILPKGAKPLGYSFEQMMSEFGIEEAVK